MDPSLPANLIDVLFRHGPAGIAIFDRGLNLLRCNEPWAETIAQVPPPGDEVRPGTAFFAVLPGAEHALQPLIAQALAGATVQQSALRVVSEGAICYWDTVFAPLWQANTVTGFVHVATDITERVLSRQLLERRVADRTRKLSALYDVMTVAAEPLDVATILQQSLGRVITAVRASAGAIQLLDESDERLHLVVQQGLDPAVVAQIGVMDADAGLSGWATVYSELLALTDRRADWRESNVTRRSHLSVYVGTPMYARGMVIGLLSVLRDTKRPFSQEDIALLDSVADQIGTAVENGRLRQQNEQLLVLEERNRLARELHDVVTQSLYSLTLFAETGKRFAEAGQLDKVQEIVARVSDVAQQALKEMRLLVHNLRPSILEQAGLEQALRQRLEAVEKRAGIQAELQVDGEVALPPHVEEALYNIAQESLNNALKHAGAGKVTLRLRYDDEIIEMWVRDNGSGFDLAELEDAGGLGLTSIRERVASLRGQATIDSAPGQGTCIYVQLDMRRVAETAAAAHILNLFQRGGYA
jgi:signal transduction histidine kinase